MNTDKFECSQSTGGFIPCGNSFDMVELISRSKVMAAFNKSCSEIEKAENVELHKIHDIISNKNKHFVDLNKTFEKNMQRNAKKLERTRNAKGKMFEDTTAIVKHIRHIKNVIKELGAAKETIENKSKDIQILWRSVNDIQLLDIPNMENEVHTIKLAIQNAQSTMKYSSDEKEILESERNLFMLEVNRATESLAPFEQDIARLNVELDRNEAELLKLIEMQNELKAVIEQNEQIIVEQKNKYDVLMNEIQTEMKSEFELEMENENVQKKSVAHKIENERYTHETAIKETNMELNGLLQKMNQQIFLHNTARDDIRNIIDEKVKEGSRMEQLTLETQRQRDVLLKRKSDMETVIMQSNMDQELDDINYGKGIEEMDRVEKEFIRALEDKCKMLKDKCDEPKNTNAQRFSLSNRLATVGNRRVATNVVCPNSFRDDDKSFLTNISDISDITRGGQTMKLSQLPSTFLQPLRLKEVIKGGVRLPRPDKPEMDGPN